MATFYIGSRPVLKGRNDNDAKRQVDAKVGTYSYFQLFIKDHVLDGAPDRNVAPGAGVFPGDIAMSRRFRGLDTDYPLKGAGQGTRPVGTYRFRPFEFKGLTADRALAGGHAARPNAFTYSWYSNFIFDGISSAEAVKTPGHAVRAVGAPGTAASFGSFSPLRYKGVGNQVLQGGGKVKPAADTDPYGNQHVQEWFGVASANALRPGGPKPGK